MVRVINNLQQSYINHIGLVLDASSSMSHLRHQTVTVADNQVKHLAQRSKEMDQETRATVYTFSNYVSCIYYDKDVLRLPSLAGQYTPSGMTALIDATLQAISDLEMTATCYGDHAFLLYVLTDGEENASSNSASRLQQKLNSLPDNWTVAAIVPGSHGVFEAKKLGFHQNNITVWDTTEKGIQEVGETIRRATDNYMTARASGVRSSNGIFQFNTDNLNTSTINSMLTKLSPFDYDVFPVDRKVAISDYIVSRTGNAYKVGSAYYELSKPEDVQANKKICVVDNASGDVYTGSEARQLLGLGDYLIRVRPVDHPKYKIFIQSTSTNRNLMPGTEVLVLKNGGR